MMGLYSNNDLKKLTFSLLNFHLKSIDKLKICCYIIDVMKIIVWIITISLLFFSSCSQITALFTKKIESDINPPALLTQSKPIYPKEAVSRGLQGRVELNILIDDSGMVKRVDVRKSSGYQILDEAGVDYAKSLRFKPAEKNGTPIPILTTFGVVFKLEEAESKEIWHRARRINNMIEDTEITQGNDREKLIREIYLELLNFYTTGYLSTLLFNKALESFVDPNIYMDWKEFTDEYSLNFLVFHDYVKRFPESIYKEDAIRMMFSIVKKDIKNINNRNLIIKIREFLKSEYSIYFGSDIEKIIKDRLKELQSSGA